MTRATAAAVIPRLEALLGSEFVTTTRTSQWAVDGFTPLAAVRPADAGQIADVLRMCAETGAAVVPWGGGTAMEIGNVPRTVDVVLLTDRLAAVIDHDHANLTVTVQAGITLGAMAPVLRAHGQFLGLEPPRAEFATAGGSVAVNLNGPRRSRYGSARDLVIGMRVAQTDGTVAKSGGKTVKNVAGYDMLKLFVGSLGTLGIIAELTLRVAPAPEASRTIAVWAGDHRRLFDLAGRVASSPLLPSAVAMVSRSAAARFGHDAPGLLVRAEGVEPAVARHERDIAGWAAGDGVMVETLSESAETAAWRAVRDAGWDGVPAAVRLSVPPGRTARLVEGLMPMLPTSARVVADLLTGTAWIECDGAEPLAAVLSGVRDLALQHAGSALVARAPRQLKATGDVWSPTPAPRVLETMWSLKLAFDPHQILNPGRFVAGI